MIQKKKAKSPKTFQNPNQEIKNPGNICARWAALPVHPRHKGIVINILRSNLLIHRSADDFVISYHGGIWLEDLKRFRGWVCD